MVLARNNPYCSERLDALTFRPQGTTWDELTARLQSMDYRGLIVGREGRGKTTLLRRLHDWWVIQGGNAEPLRLSFRQGFLLPAQRRRLQGLPESTLLFVDGLEQLNFWGWRQLRAFARNLRGLVATSHHRGRLPLLIECRTSANLFIELATELAGSSLGVDRDQLVALFDKHRGNIRNGLHELYDLAAMKRGETC